MEVSTPSGSLSPAVEPSIASARSTQQVLRLRWDADGNKGEDKECTVPVARLRQHCNSATARNLRQKFGSTTEVANPDPNPVLWGKGVLTSDEGDGPRHFEYKQIMEDDQQATPAASPSPSSQTAACRLLSRLKSHGIVLVRGVPTDVSSTEAFGLKLGRHHMGTSSGSNGWSVSTAAAESEYSSIDTAYTRDALLLHTDCAFLKEPPGLEVNSFSLRGEGWRTFG